MMKCKECDSEMMRVTDGLVCPNGHGRVQLPVYEGRTSRKKERARDMAAIAFEALAEKLNEGSSQRKAAMQIERWMRDEYTATTRTKLAVYLLCVLYLQKQRENRHDH